MDIGHPQKFFQGGQRPRFAYPFQVTDDVMQMDINKTLCPFDIAKKMPHVTVTTSNFPFLPPADAHGC